MKSPRPQTMLLISQVYVPDPAAVGQHLHDAALEMVRRGWRVIVLTSGRGYDNPAQKFAPRETLDGVEICRLPFSSLGKKTILHRIVGQMIFLMQVILRGLFMPRPDRLLVSTSPPFASMAALVIAGIRRVPIKFWLMDLNPDQAVALGKVKPGSLAVRAFNWLNRRIYSVSTDIVVLDAFMAARVTAKLPAAAPKLITIPPWPHEEHLEPIAHDANPFRHKHNLAGKFVFMYSGNMSVASPLTTILEAALKLQEDDRIRFMFIGGGLGKKEVEDVIAQHHPQNIALLPYQPMSELKYSLSAADVHLVTLGRNMVGMIHPCKIYGAMTVARPILYVGPQPSHITRIIEQCDIGWGVEHGEVDELLALIRRIADTPPNQLAAIGQRSRDSMSQRFSRAKLCGAFCDVMGK